MPPDDLIQEEPEPLAEAPAKQETISITEAHQTEFVDSDGFNDDILAPDCKWLLNHRAVRLTALKLINERFPVPPGKKLPPRFRRMSPEFINTFERAVRHALVQAILRHPSPTLSGTIKEY